jgi:Ca2+-transporting ATPase
MGKGSTQDVEERKTPLQINMEELGQKLSIMSFAVIGVIMLIGIAQGRPLVKVFAIAVSL